jgi:hypothetical protein
LVKIAATPVWVWVIRQVGVGQPEVTQLTAAFDAIENEYPEDDEGQTTKSTNDTDDRVRSRFVPV